MTTVLNAAGVDKDKFVDYTEKNPATYKVKLSQYFWLRQELRESQCVSVCPSGTSLFRAVNLHLSRSEH